MAKPRTLTYPVTLTTAQLSFLLTAVRAERLFGVDNRQLFPQDPDERQQLLQTGQQQLEQDKWLVREGNSYDLNPQLLLLIATMAAAQIITLTQITAPQQPSQEVTHHVSEQMVVEVTYTGEVYQLTALKSVAVMANRLAYTFDLPATVREEAVFDLTQTQVRQIQAELNTIGFMDAGSPKSAVGIYTDVMRHLRRRGQLQFVRLDVDSIVARRQLGVLVATNGMALTAVPHGQIIHYQATNLGEFQRTVIEIVEQLQGEANAWLHAKS